MFYKHGIITLNKIFEAIIKLAPPNDIIQVRKCFGVIDYYRDIWEQRSHMLDQLRRLISNKSLFKWTYIEHKVFEIMVNYISRDVLLTYPKSRNTFDIHTYASHSNIDAVISQEIKPLAFFSIKPNYTKERYTITEVYILSTIETLREFRSILLEKYIRIYTYHKTFNFMHSCKARELLYGPSSLKILGY